MPESVSNSAGICAAICVMSPVILCMPAESPLPVETMVILSTFASGAARARTTSGSPVMQLVDHRGLVPFLIGLGLHVHGLGFGFAFLQDDFGFGFTLRADGGGVAFGFGGEPHLLGARQRFDAAALDFGLLRDGRDQFILAALDFGFLHLDLLFLFHLLDLDLLRRSPAAA